LQIGKQLLTFHRASHPGLQVTPRCPKPNLKFSGQVLCEK